MMTPELTAAIRSGALPLVERMVFDLVHEAYANGRLGIEAELKLMHVNRDQWRSMAFEAKDKMQAMQAEIVRLREANYNATGWLAEAYDLADEAIPYAGEYFNEKWELSKRLSEIADARAAMKGDEPCTEI
jgi:hypothetical protein